MTIENLIPEIYKHMEEELPREACGVVILFKGRFLYKKCRNISEDIGIDNFVISPEDYADAEDLGEVMYIVHSHPNTGPSPSIPDLLSIEQTKLPWIIVSANYKYTITEPSGFKTPLLGRTFIHGTLDCYGFIRDYYREILNIELNNHYREDEWWTKGKDYYMDFVKSDGWVEVPLEQVKEHDMIFMKMASPVINHAAIYVGNNNIMHHGYGRLSSKEVYGTYYRLNSVGAYRYKDLYENS